MAKPLEDTPVDERVITPETAVVQTLTTAVPVAPAPTLDIPNPPLPATTTYQEDITTAGQRRVNLIWEYTQAGVASLVVLANMIVGVAQGLGLTPDSKPFPVILSSSLFLIVGFYFSRTNHQAIGGVGYKPNESQRYTGR